MGNLTIMPVGHFYIKEIFAEFLEHVGSDGLPMRKKSRICEPFYRILYTVGGSRAAVTHCSGSGFKLDVVLAPANLRTSIFPYLF